MLKTTLMLMRCERERERGLGWRDMAWVLGSREQGECKQKYGNSFRA